MFSRKRDFKNKKKYNSPKNKIKKTLINNTRLIIIIRYSLLILIVLLSSIILSIALSQRENGDTENQINDIYHNIKVKSLLVISAETDKSNSENSNHLLNISSYYIIIFDINRNYVSYFVLPPSLNLSSNTKLPEKILNENELNNIPNIINQNIPFLNLSSHIVFDISHFEDLINEIGGMKIFIENNNKFTKQDYTYLSNKYKKFINSPNISNKTELINYISFHSILIQKLIDNYDIVKSYYTKNKYNIFIKNGTEETLTHNTLSSLHNSTIKFINSPIKINDKNELSINYNEIKSAIENFDKEKQYDKDNLIKISIINGTKKYFEISAINKNIEKYYLELIDYKSNNLFENTILINANMNIADTFYLSQKLKLPVYALIQSSKKMDIDLILYLGTDYNDIFDF